MGFRFRKSVKIAPGVRMNFGKKSTSISVGGKYHHTTISSTGRRTKTTSIPGTGISYVSTSSGSRSRSSHRGGSHRKQASPLMLKVCGVIMLIIGVLSLLLAIVGFCTAGAAGLLFLIIGIPCILIGRLWTSGSKQPKNE